MAPILTVIGATGAQGSSVVDNALKAGVYQVRAVTRNPNSEKGKALAAKGAEVVQADVNDEESLIKAFHGSTAIYAVTDFFEPFAKGGPEEGQKVEVQQGKNLANAAAKTATLEHYIWSTLPNGLKISDGKYLVPHFEAKNKIDAYIRENKELYAKTTFLWVTFYAANLYFPMYTPIWVKTAGKYIQTGPVPPTVPLYTIGDTVKNVGVFTNAILAKPELSLPSKIVLAYTEETTVGGFLETWTAATGKPSQYVEVNYEAWDKLWPLWGAEMGGMQLFWNEAQEKSWTSTEQDVITKTELGIKDNELVQANEAFKNIDWAFLH